MPDDAGADARVDGSTSNGDLDTCEDGDGDGVLNVTCGGADCDDSNPNRFPGNLEICEFDHVDEDCDPTTFGGADVDGDSYEDAACCNSDAAGMLDCGFDCDDVSPSVNPAASEACDRIDNNCDGRVDEGYDPATCWAPCPPGTIQIAPPSAVNPPVCDDCSPGAYCPGGLAMRQPCVASDWDHDANAGTVCVPRSTCVAGHFVMVEGDAVNDRVCAPCADGSYSTTSNATLCMAWSVLCFAGHYLQVPGSSTNDRGCQSCADGTFSTTTNAVICTAWRDCEAGYAATAPTATADRVCAACGPGTFSTTINAGSCAPHTTCEPGELETTVPSATLDRECGLFADVALWSRQFGTVAYDTTRAITVVGDGGTRTAGVTAGAIDGQVNLGGYDGFVRADDAAGQHLWTRQFGTDGVEQVYRMVSDDDGNLIIVGSTTGTFASQSSFGSQDAFVRKYDAAGQHLWTSQFGTDQSDTALAVAVDGNGSVIVTGQTNGAFQGLTQTGSTDAFVRKYDGDGTPLWTQQFGASSASGHALGVAANGDVIVAGSVAPALPGQIYVGSVDAFLRRYDADGALLWTRQFGTTSGDAADVLAINVNGNILVAGQTSGMLSGTVWAGASDVFVRAYGADGELLWTRQFGTAANDGVSGISIGVDGFYVAGWTNGALNGQQSVGMRDAFLTWLDTDGVVLGVRQFGSSTNDESADVAFGADGHVLIAGTTAGALPGQTTAGGIDAFIVSFPAW